VGKHFIRSYHYSVYYLDCSIFSSRYVAELLDCLWKFALYDYPGGTNLFRNHLRVVMKEGSS